MKKGVAEKKFAPGGDGEKAAIVWTYNYTEKNSWRTHQTLTCADCWTQGWWNWKSNYGISLPCHRRQHKAGRTARHRVQYSDVRTAECCYTDDHRAVWRTADDREVHTDDDGKTSDMELNRHRTVHCRVYRTVCVHNGTDNGPYTADKTLHTPPVPQSK